MRNAISDQRKCDKLQWSLLSINRQLKPQSDWPTDSEELRIQRGIDGYPDNSELTDEDFARMRPCQARQKVPINESAILRIDADILAWYRSTGLDGNPE
jgi:uncharacterized protein (DUF4415 family)